MFCPLPWNQPTLPGLPHVWHFKSILFLHCNWDLQSSLTEHGASSSPVKMIDCPSDSLAALHNIPVGCVVFHGAGQKKQDLKHKYSKCFHIRHLSWPEFCSFKAVACILSIILKHMIEWERMMSLICSQSWTYLVTIYNENNLSEKSIGHKRAERKKKGFNLCFKGGPLVWLSLQCKYTWFILVPGPAISWEK